VIKKNDPVPSKLAWLQTLFLEPWKGYLPPCFIPSVSPHISLQISDKATPDGYIYCEIQKGMYGLPQAGIIAQQLLEERLEKHGYRQSKTTPGLWKHNTRPISFTLVVDNFGVKYVGEENAQHLLNAVRQYYKCSSD
jgi:hypothetical protein